jgi:hypothetical protein
LPGKFSEYAQLGKPIAISAPGPWIDLIPSDTHWINLRDLDDISKPTLTTLGEVFDAKAAAARLLALLESD